VPTYIALLRGINVGGRRSVPMAALREVHARLGYTDVVTYIQSGNVVFDADSDDVALLSRTIEQAITADFGIGVPVIVRTREDLVTIIESSPYTTTGADPARLAVAFLADAPAMERAVGIDATGLLPDEFALGEREVYLHCPSGFGRTKLTNAFLEEQLGVTATTRNWKTVTKLAALSDRGVRLRRCPGGEPERG
jgi:uncharacterized protein (DUF1697 family)